MSRTAADCYSIEVIGDQRNRWVCHYCGCPADTVDHIPPLSRYHDAAAVMPMLRPVKVPSCAECNTLAGSQLHWSFLERAAYVKAGLASRYARQLRVVEWADDELAEMGYQFRVSIQRDMAARRFIEARLAYVPV